MSIESDVMKKQENKTQRLQLNRETPNWLHCTMPASVVFSSSIIYNTVLWKLELKIIFLFSQSSNMHFYIES